MPAKSVHVGAYLNWFDANKRCWLDLPLATATPLTISLAELSEPAEEVVIGLVDQQAVTEADHQLAGGDVLELFPPLGGG